MAEIKNYTINFGPQHPSAHGVLRLILELDGETVLRADPHIGFLHRGTEKLVENRTYMQALPYMDRLDYLSMMANEHAYVRAIEGLLGIDVPERAQYIRVMFDEITRILSHLLWLGAQALDMGAMAVFLYAFREREDLMDCYEAVSGTRMHAAYYRPGGVAKDLPETMPLFKKTRFQTDKRVESLNEHRHGTLLDFIEAFTERFPTCVDEYETLLTDNRIFKQRLVGIGVISPEDAIAAGFTGPMLRGSGVAWDLRRKAPYAVYDKIDFKIPVGKEGDCFDRYLVRIAEMRESNEIIRQCVKWLREHPGDVIARGAPGVPPEKSRIKAGMEEMISHFKHFSEGFHVPEGRIYSAVEAPKGEFGIFLVSDGSNKPFRLKIRAPSFVHLQGLEKLIKGHLIPDAVAVIGSIDIVFGEVDR